MNEYNFRSIELKWQKKWADEKYGQSADFDDKPKHFHLVEFPYPSGSGLHVGHLMGYGASDAYCRMKRLQGFNVMFPIGWDAFGLPTENFAIKNKIKPQKATADNVVTFKRQINSLGYAFDWDREINTTDPEYYHWTQWIFLQFYKHAIIDGKLVEVADDDRHTPRLAFQAEMPVNWCPSCKINLANEEVIDGNCERCGTVTEKRMQKQWILRITAYADRLASDLDTVDYLDKIKTQQINWIGKSTGTNVRFKVEGYSGTVKDEEIEFYTTRIDTFFGTTFVVLSPEHPILEKLGYHIQNYHEVKEYVAEAAKKSDLERTELQKDKTGIKCYGVYAVNPLNNEKIEIWVADYVLGGYGTGSVIGVPAHDQRDFEFATKHQIPIKYVVEPKFTSTDGDNAVRIGSPFVKRDLIAAIVRNPKDDKFLCISWKKFKMHGLVTGGIEDGETPEDAARREVAEETGYKNLKYIRTAPLAINTFFYHRMKQVNRHAHFQFVEFELENEEKNEINEEEKDSHDVTWVSRNDLSTFFTVPEGNYMADLIKNGDRALIEYGLVTNSGEFYGLSSDEAKIKITEKLKSVGAGDFATNYKLRDWIFSRQHYWGEPIPIVYCQNCAKTIGNSQDTRDNNQKPAAIPLPDDQLPLILPEVENYEPSDTGESPLSKITDWVETTCPKCGGKAIRETDTMPNWAGSSWYYLAYTLVKSLKLKVKSGSNIFTEHTKELKYWLDASGAPRSSKSGGGVDIYNGGMEHTTLHLLYSRFWHKFLFDLDVVPTAEPYAKRIAHGIILGPDGRKMSKSFGNVINPDEIVKQFGADTLRAYIMFIGPYDQESAWSTAGVQGVHRFLNRVWRNSEKVVNNDDSKELLIKLNQTIAGVTSDLENFRMNTVISKLMEMNNLIEQIGKISKESWQKFLLLLSPVAPHIASELFGGNILDQSWPKADEKYLSAEKITIVIQINGKVRDKVEVDADVSDDDLKKIALESNKIQKITAGKEIKKVIVVPKKLVSIVI